MRLDLERLSGPLLVAWQLTYRCGLSCVHCCLDCGPGRGEGELPRSEALRVAAGLASSNVPYVLLCGGEPLCCGHFFDVAEALGSGGVELKVESNGQALGALEAERLARLPIRSVQISIDGSTQETYARIRPGASLEKALAACRRVRAAGLPLELSYVPTRLNLGEAEAVARLALSLGAFRLNTGALMPLGRAASALETLEPDAAQYADYRALLERLRGEFAGRMELCYLPFTLAEGLEAARAAPPATLLVLPDGRVKVSGALPLVCGDLRTQGLAEVWDAYRAAWRDAATLEAAERAARDLSCPYRAGRDIRSMP